MRGGRIEIINSLAAARFPKLLRGLRSGIRFYTYEFLYTGVPYIETYFEIDGSHLYCTRVQ